MSRMKQITSGLNSGGIISKSSNINIINRNKTTVVLKGGEIKLVDNRYDFQYLISSELKKSIIASLADGSNFTYLTKVKDYFYEIREELIRSQETYSELIEKEVRYNTIDAAKVYAEKKLIEAITDVVDLVNYLDYSNEDINRLLTNHYLPNTK